MRCQKLGDAAGNVDQLPDQIAINPLRKIGKIKVNVLNLIAQFARVIIPQRLRRQPRLQITRRGDKSPARLGHLLAIHHQKPMRKQPRRTTMPAVLQHGRPKQTMKIQNVLADKMIQLSRIIIPPKIIKSNLRTARAQVAKTRHITYRRIQPHIKILLLRNLRNAKAKIRRITRNVPITQITTQPLN